MHWIDILVIIILLVSGGFAYMRGFVHEVLSIVGWVGAVFATMYGTPVLKHFTRQIIDEPFFADLVTGILIFIVTLAVISIITRRVSKDVKDSALGALDRALGFLFGLARGAVIVCLIWISYEWFTPPKEQPESIYEARTMPWIIQGAEILKALVPETEDGQNGGEEPNAPDQDGQSLLDKAINAVPRAQEKPKNEGYGQKERTEMDRLFETNK